MGELHIEVVGRGPDLVLLHGWALNLRVWDGLVRELFDRFRLIAVDLPGHGRSPWTAARATPAEQTWLVHQSLAAITNRYSLLGWSLGGQIALDLAAATPGPIDRLILVGSSARFAAAPDWPHGMSDAHIARMAERLTGDYRGTVSDFLELQVRGSSESEQTLRQMRHALLVHGEAQPAALAAGLDRLTHSDLRSMLPHVHVPVLAIAGQHDRIIRPEATRATAMLLPDGKFVAMRRAAHAPFLSHPREFAALVAGFLRPARRRAKKISASACGRRRWPRQ